MTTEDTETELNRLVERIEKSDLMTEISQIKVKALLNELNTLQSERPIRWTYIPTQLVRNITGIMMELEDISNTYSVNSNEFKTISHQVARAWESLGKLEERTSRRTAFLNSAICYEMAGYQANALTMSRQLFSGFSIDSIPSLEILVNSFLQRLFLLTKEMCIKALSEANVKSSEEPVGAIGLAMVARGLQGALEFLLNGNENNPILIQRSFDNAARIYENTDSYFEYNLVKDLAKLIPLLNAKSTWNVIGKVLDGNKKWKRYLKLLARGTGDDLLRSPSISEIWPSQIKALDSGLLGDTSKVIKMPTSAGKTRVAEIAMVYTLLAFPDSKIIYTAPYRALVYEVQQNFSNLFGDMGFKVSSLSGNYETDELEQAIAANTDVLVTTPEKLDLLFRINQNLLGDVRLFIIDEGQIISNARRGVKFEFLITRLKRKFPKIRFLFLSAVVSEQTLQDLAKWFEVSDGGTVESSWRPSLQRYAKFKWLGSSGQILYVPDLDLGTQLASSEFVPRIIQQKIYSYINPKSDRKNSRKFPKKESKGEIAAELAIRFAELGSVLVFCPQTNFADSVASVISERIDLSINSNEAVPQYFLNPKSTRSLISSKEWLGSDHFLTKVLERNVAVHHGNIPNSVRKAIEQDFRDKNIRILVATNTLAQGVNLPIRTVIVHSSWRHNPNGESERISSNDYWNIAGRAGRAGQETEGTIIHIVSSRTDEADFEYFNNAREHLEPIESSLLQELKGLLSLRISQESSKKKLDPDVLAMVVEEGKDLFSHETVKEVLNGTLLSIQAKRFNMDVKPIQDVIYSLGKEIENDTEFNVLSVYNATGLSTQSCKQLSVYINENEERIRQFISSASSEHINEIIDLVLESVLNLDEMQTEHSYPGDLSELIESWITGKELQDIITSTEEIVKSEDLAKFIEDLFTNKLPWGVSALVRIAKYSLGLNDNDISIYLRFFPTMIKFGVPSPEAAWALSSGIPFRKTAIEIATSFIRAEKESNYSTFQKWLKEITEEDLSYKYGLKNPILEDTNRAISQSTVNDLLKQYSDTRDALPIEIYVHGVQYAERRFVALGSKVGEEVVLARDYNNLADRNSIKIFLKGRELGFVPKEYAQLFAPDMDTGLTLRGEIASVQNEEVPHIKIRVHESNAPY